ncbi:hypothetical protein FACS1894186_7940 [Alphaproteobacteria bacterium]|nr:hypothetical protein FACS1894186_7940 [Alphaproteobacteria bacterium]
MRKVVRRKRTLDKIAEELEDLDDVRAFDMAMAKPDKKFVPLDLAKRKAPAAPKGE